MNSLIEELIFQKGRFLENVPYNESYQELSELGDKIYNKLTKTLNKEQIELLNKLVDNHAYLCAEACNCNLIQGFKTGLKLMAECL